MTLSPDGRTLAVQTDGGIEIVDVARMRISGFLLDSDTTVTAPVFIGNGIVAAGSREGWVRMWSPATSRSVSPRLAAHSGAVVALAVSPDRHTLASGGTDGSVEDRARSIPGEERANAVDSVEGAAHRSRAVGQ